MKNNNIIDILIAIGLTFIAVSHVASTAISMKTIYDNDTIKKENKEVSAFLFFSIITHGIILFIILVLSFILFYKIIKQKS
jgi:uncharacterized BrkB/YihY/UPF0761 family membrane protein